MKWKNQFTRHLANLLLAVTMVFIVGCKTQITRKADWETHFTALHFVDAKHGWIAGRGVLLRTENGGEAWQAIREGLETSTIDYDPNSPTFHTSISKLTIEAMQLINPQEGWICANERRIAHTTDGGFTWTFYQTGVTTAMITALHFIGRDEGWVVAPHRIYDGVKFFNGLILHTVNGGDDWEIQTATNQLGVGIYFADAQSGWIVLANGRSLITHDGGTTWKLGFSKLNGHRVHHVKFGSHIQAWGVGDDKTLLVTRDQGENWT